MTSIKNLSNLLTALVIIVTAFTSSPSASARAEGDVIDAGVVGNGTPASCTEAALNTALTGGGTITFNCGGPTTILITSEKSLTQNTTIDGGGTITITGNLATRLFSTVPGAGTPLEMRNIILDKGYSNNASGAAIRAFGPLTLTNVTVQNSIAATGYCGGAMLISGDALISNSTFNQNTAVLGGGAICVRAPSTATVRINNSALYSNLVTDATQGLGGGLYVEYGNVVVLDSVFLGNRAHFGGAVYALLNTASVSLQGSPTSTIFASKMQLNANSATEDGGAIYNKDGALSINNAVITVNKTPTQTLLAGYGGAIYTSSALTLTNAIVSQNEGRYGGGLFVGVSDAAQAVIDRTLFSRNISGNLGGGLYTNQLAATVTISNSAFNRNTADGAGGGLARTNSKLRIYNTSFTNNSAAQGGGMLLQAVPAGSFAGYVQVRSATFSGNTAAANKGGAVYSFNSGVELYYTTIVSNTNGVYSTGNGNTRFRSSVLQNPGSLNCDGDGTASISDDSKNLSTDTSCVLPNSQVGTTLDPKLGPLTFDTVGITAFHMPLVGSPLINAGYSNCPVRDQINALRPDACDIGAVEFGGLLDRARLPVVIR